VSNNVTTQDAKSDGRARRTALRFVVLIGILSFFADFTYEGSRSIIGPYLATLQATGTVVGVVTGFGEMLGYGLRLVSGRWADATGRYWPITIFGYVVQMAAVPALALTGSWPAAAALIILERVGKAIRNPPRDVMLSHAGKQVGAMAGPSDCTKRSINSAPCSARSPWPRFWRTATAIARRLPSCSCRRSST
jgi:hypothetical protein